MNRTFPMMEDYPSCARVYAFLEIESSKKSPDTITNILGIFPTNTKYKGQKISKCTDRVSNFNRWEFSSENAIKSFDVRHHLDWILNKLCDKKESLSRLQEMSCIGMHLTCVWWAIEDVSGGPVLWPEHMHAIGDLNLELFFDIYQTDERF